MDEINILANECQPLIEQDDDALPKLKMFEIYDAIHDIDSRLRELEIALNLNPGHNTANDGN